MCDHLDDAEGKLDRRTLVVRSAGLLAVTGLAGGGVAASLGWPGTGEASDHHPAWSGSRRSRSAAILESVTGPVPGSAIQRPLAHEHFFVDFLGPTSHEYMDVDWADVTGACVNSAQELRAQGVDLFVDWTNLGVGRNVLLLRDVSRQSGVSILTATGIYKSLIPPQFHGVSIADIAAHFHTELTKGIDGTRIRAGWIKIATTESGPTASDTRIHRAAARAARRAGSAISLHSPFPEATRAVVATLEQEGFDLRRFIWGHAQPSPVSAHKALATRGATIQYDGISADADPFFNGPTDDESMLDRVQEMVEAGFDDRVIVSTDASVFVNPAQFQYDRDNTYFYRYFLAKLEDRIGATAMQKVVRDNVVLAFRRGRNVP